MKKFIFKLSTYLGLLALLSVVVFVVSLLLVPLDKDYGAYKIYAKKKSLIKENGNSRLSVILGGSSVRFGVDTKILNSSDTEYYNFGMYAGYGIEPYMYVLRDLKSEVDEIIIMFEDDLYFKSTNVGTFQKFHFLKENKNYFYYDPLALIYAYDYLWYQSQLLFNKVRHKELSTPYYENIVHLTDEYGNLVLDTLDHIPDFTVYRSRVYNNEKMFDYDLLDFITSLAEEGNVRLKMTFVPIFCDEYEEKSVRERREFIKSKYNSIDWIEHNSIYTNKMKFFNSRYHLNSNERRKFSTQFNSKIK
jgi:hypothetical protein